MIERGSARQGALAVVTREVVGVGAWIPKAGAIAVGEACDEAFQITAWFTPFETAAQPATVPTLLMATATLGFGSPGLSFTMAPFASHVEATIDPDAGSKSAPTTVPFEFTAVAYP
jgi:hypothetical protein